jgi:hypothetical protein
LAVTNDEVHGNNHVGLEQKEKMTIPKKSIVNKSIAKGEDKQLMAMRGQSTKEKPKTRVQGLVDTYEL